MRVAQRMISRNYRRQVNSSLKKQADTLERSESGLKFKRLSDNVAAGNRAMHLQEERYQATQQLENTKDLIAEMKSVDSNMDSIHSVLQKVQERMLMGMSEDYGATARSVIAKEIHSAKEQILQFVNNQFGGKYLFAGTNNSTQPFTTGADGKVQFNGIPVEQIYRDSTDGKYYYQKQLPASAEGEWIEFDSGIAGETPFLLKKVSTDPTTGIMTYQGVDSAGANGVYYTKDGTTWSKDADMNTNTTVTAATPLTMQEYRINGEAVYADQAEVDAGGMVTYRDAQGNPVLTKNVATDEISSFYVGTTKYSQDTVDKTKYTNGATSIQYTLNDDGTFTKSDGTKLDLSVSITEPTIVPNSGDTYADIGLGLKIDEDMFADTRTAFQVSFSGLTLMGCAEYDEATGEVKSMVEGKQHGTQVATNVYDLLTQIEASLTPVMDKAALDDQFTKLVELTDDVGLTRTDLGNRMQYLEQTEDRLKDDINDMTELETDLISSDPAKEAIKMKECEYVWLAVMQLGSKILPASLLDFMS